MGAERRVQGGTYILRIRLRRPLALGFGRFQGGRALPLAAGVYAYVGSALGRPGVPSLARRLLRHATRTDGSAQRVRARLGWALKAAGLADASVRPPLDKTRRWHIDYLLDHPAAALVGVIAIPGEIGCETALAGVLADDPMVRAPARGLGASDDPGHTHLLAVPEAAAWWAGLPQRWGTALGVDPGACIELIAAAPRWGARVASAKEDR